MILTWKFVLNLVSSLISGKKEGEGQMIDLPPLVDLKVVDQAAVTDENVDQGQEKVTET